MLDRSKERYFLTSKMDFSFNAYRQSQYFPQKSPPRRPLSAYNIFFQVERKRLLAESQTERPYTTWEVDSVCLETDCDKRKRMHRKVHGKITFIELSKVISTKWKNLCPLEKLIFESKAEEEKRVYAVKREYWLSRPRPTPQVKKSLAALRRGSMKKYLTNIENKNNLNQRHVNVPSTTSPVSTMSVQSDYGCSSPVLSASNKHKALSCTVHKYERMQKLQALYRQQVHVYEKQMCIRRELARTNEALCQQNCERGMSCSLSSRASSCRDVHDAQGIAEIQHFPLDQFDSESLLLDASLEKQSRHQYNLFPRQDYWEQSVEHQEGITERISTSDIHLAIPFENEQDFKYNFDDRCVTTFPVDPFAEDFDV